MPEGTELVDADHDGVADNTEMLRWLQGEVIRYFDRECDHETGLVSDSSRDGSACSIAAVGLGLAAACCRVHAGQADRAEVVDRVLATLRTFAGVPQSAAPDAGGFHGFFYHFTHMKTGGGRAGRRCRASTPRSSSPGRWWPRSSSTAARPKRRRSAGWPTGCTGRWSGTG